MLKGVAVRRSVAAAIAPLARERFREVAAQQRFALRLALLSPPILTADALTATARTNATFYGEQRDAATAYLPLLSAALIDAALGRRPVSGQTFDALPRFAAPMASGADPMPVLWLRC